MDRSSPTTETVDGVSPGDMFDDQDGRRQHVVETRIDEAGHGRCTCYSGGKLYDFHTVAVRGDLYDADDGAG